MADAPYRTDPTRATGVVIAFPDRARDTESEVADLWRAWVAENDELMARLPEYDASEDLEFITNFEALGNRVGAKIQRILAARSAGPITMAAKLHLALQFTDSSDASDYPRAFLGSALRDLLPYLPPDMAARLEPLAADLDALLDPELAE